MIAPTPQDIAKANELVGQIDWVCSDLPTNLRGLKATISTTLAAERSHLDDEFAKARDMYLGKIGQLEAECGRMSEALQIAVQLECALTEYLDNLEWKPRRAHIERARNDAARMLRALVQPAPTRGEREP